MGGWPDPRTSVLRYPEVLTFLLATQADQVALLECVAGGFEHFRYWMRRLFPQVTREETREAFAYLCYAVQRRWGGVPAGRVLDALEVVSPPTPEEVARAWRVESASSEEGRRWLYGGEAPQAVLERLVRAEEGG